MPSCFVGEKFMPLSRLNCNEIKEGVTFSAPVFFEDSVNMFLAANHPVRRYHVTAIERWKIPFLMTCGHKNDQEAASVDMDSELEELAEEFSSDGN